MTTYYEIKGADEAKFKLGNGHIAASWQHRGAGPEPRYPIQQDACIAQATTLQDGLDLMRVFVAADKRLLPAIEEWYNHPENIVDQSGCTAALALVNGKRIYTANLGDSRIYAFIAKANGNNARGFQLTNDHTVENPQEVARVASQGGHIVKEHYFWGCRS